ncbi:MAG: hypothetical protein GX145_00945 [Clostridiaceae bacterium]|jgi:hypothetical protein|nr:hypothetical protein [Bacillota bacterium]NLN51365.1 hypothetical protein [Clostridiaceae bacterium]
MKKYLLYAMEGEKMCFLHCLMNARQLKDAGHEVKIILEGKSCALAPQLEKEGNKLYLSLKEDGTIYGVCLACSKVLGVYEENEAAGLRFLDDMNSHAGFTSFAEQDYEVVVF